MAGALQGTGTPSVYPMQQLPWGQPWGIGGISSFPGQQPFAQQLGHIGGQIGGQFGAYVPQQLQSLQAAVQQLLQLELVQQQHLQLLLQTVPLQLHQIQHLIQLALQQAYQSPQLYGQQPFLPTGGFPLASQGLQPQMFGGQIGFGPQTGYPQTGYPPQTGYVM